MFSAMRQLVNHLKVLDSIVQAIAVDMVNMFGGLKLSSKMLLKGYSMFADPSPGRAYFSIPSTNACSKTRCLSVPPAAFKLSATSRCSTMEIRYQP